jgi:RND family efflux transporter MFP subunit
VKRILVLLVLLALSYDVARAQELTVVEVRPFCANCITATGRAQAPMSAKVGSRVSGVLAEFGKDDKGRMLDDGATVKAGDVLFKLDETTFRNAVALAEAGVKSAQADLNRLVAPLRSEEMEQLRQTIGQLDVRIASKQRDEQRFRQLVEEALPLKQMEELQTDLAVLQSQRKAAQAKLDEAIAGPTPTDIAAVKAQVEKAQASLKVAQDDLRDSAVKAPFAGLITHRYKSPGDYIANMPPTDVVELMAVDRLEAELRLPEAYLRSVQIDKSPVLIRSPLLAQEIKSTVGRVIANIDLSNGTFAIKVTIPSGGGLAPGAFVTAEVQVDSPSTQVLVPLRAIVSEGGKNYVFVVEESKMMRRVVEVSERLTELAVVKSGLAAGDKVLIGPLDKLKEGAALPEHLVKK